MPSQPDLKTALARITELNRALGLDPAKDPVLAAFHSGSKCEENIAAGDPIASAANDMIRHLNRKISEVETKRRAERERLDTRIRLRDRAMDEETKQEAQQWITEEQSGYNAAMAAFDTHLSALRNKIERLKTNPNSMFLPLGTIVRFKDTPSYPNSLSICQDAPDKEYPVPGTVGVVTRLNHKNEYPISVSIRRPFQDGYGDTVYPDYDRFCTYFVDPEKVEFIEPGLLPDGRPCTSYGYLPTHQRLERSLSSDREDEMIVEADGFFWRFHDFGGTQAIEALQAYERIEEMTWVGAPLGNEPSKPVCTTPSE